MRREVPIWAAVLVIVIVLVVVIGAYVWLTSPRRAEETITKPPATVIPGQAGQGQMPQKPAEAQ